MTAARAAERRRRAGEGRRSEVRRLGGGKAMLALTKVLGQMQRGRQLKEG